MNRVFAEYFLKNMKKYIDGYRVCVYNVIQCKNTQTVVLGTIRNWREVR